MLLKIIICEFKSSEFTKYRENDDFRLIYHRADTHWNSLGKRMFVKETSQEINALMGNV